MAFSIGLYYNTGFKKSEYIIIIKDKLGYNIVRKRR